MYKLPISFTVTVDRYQNIEMEGGSVTTEGDTIFFFCDVDDDTVKELCVALKKLTLMYETIKIAIRSSGGEVYAGLAAMDFIRTLVKNGKKIETVAYGFCASSATFILMAGTRRFMGENSFVLIHQLSVECGGCYNELRDDMRMNKKLMKHFGTVYAKYTTIPESVLQKILSRDCILSASKCLKYNIVDEII